MPSKGVLDRQRVGKAIVAAARTHARQVGDRLQTSLAAVVEDGETLPDLTNLQLLFARHLERHLDALLAADELHLAELDDDSGVRHCRDVAAAALYDQVVAVRDLVRACLGADGAAELLGVEGRTPQDPLMLLRWAERMLGRLREPGAQELPAGRLPSIELDLKGIPTRLEEKIGNLRNALSAVAREEREAETTQLRKDAAFEAFDNVARGVADILRGWCQLAGFPEFADGTRLTLPSRRRAA